MDFLEELNSSVLCGDGAMGTELMSSGVPVEVCFEELNVSAPELVSRIHDSYVQAGARLIETNTFGANACAPSQAWITESRSRIEPGGHSVWPGNRSASAPFIWRPASGRWVSLTLRQNSRRSTGQTCSKNKPRPSWRRGSTSLFLETFVDFDEIQIALNAVRTLDAKIPVICSMVCSEEGRLPSSLPIVQAFRELIRLGANVVGVNCVTGPNAMSHILRRIPLEFPISAFPNAGYPRYHDGRFFYNAAPQYFADAAKEFVAQGAVLIGGCCGVGPEHIRAMAQAIAGLKPRSIETGRAMGGRAGIAN